MEIRGVVEEVIPSMVMVTMEFFTIALTILASTVISKGLSPFVFVVYSNSFGSIFLIFYCLFFDRHQAEEKHGGLTFQVYLRIFFLGLIGISITQNLAFLGLSYSSPIVACGMGNLIPAFSFILSIILSIPVVDLAGINGGEDRNRRKAVVELVREASETWGFFQVVNHSIPLKVLDNMLDGVRSFYEQDNEIKKQWYTRDGSETVVYNSNFDLFRAASANWRDTTYVNMAPNTPNSHQLPEACRDILIEYSKKVTNLGRFIFELLSEALGLNSNHLNDMDCSEGLAVLYHYYPACPEPELTLGASKHADYDFLTVLLQDQIGGLQVLCGNRWVDVPPIPGALVVNIGDLMQLITNDKFKSSQHRVLANHAGPRVSVACFFTTGLAPSPKIYGPIKELLSENNSARYRETTVREYSLHYNAKGLGITSALLDFRL